MEGVDVAHLMKRFNVRSPADLRELFSKCEQHFESNKSNRRRSPRLLKATPKKKEETNKKRKLFNDDEPPDDDGSTPKRCRSSPDIIAARKFYVTTLLQKVDARYCAPKNGHTMFKQMPTGEFLNIAKFTKIANPILLTTPEALNKRMVLKEMKATVKKRRNYHVRHWKKKGTHAVLKYGGSLPGSDSDSSAEEQPKPKKQPKKPKAKPKKQSKVKPKKQPNKPPKKQPNKPPKKQPKIRFNVRSRADLRELFSKCEQHVESNKSNRRRSPKKQPKKPKFKAKPVVIALDADEDKNEPSLSDVEKLFCGK